MTEYWKDIVLGVFALISVSLTYLLKRKPREVSAVNLMGKAITSSSEAFNMINSQILIIPHK